MAKEAYYFSHDANSRNDPKILSMMLDYGVEGYGMFWIVVENLREQDGYKMKQDKSTWRALAMQMHKTVEESKVFLQECVDEYELFESDGIYFYSPSLLRRMDKKDVITQKRKDAANARWNGNNNTNVMQMHSKSNAQAMQLDAKESKLKESKLKEMKLKVKEKKIYREFKHLSITTEEFERIEGKGYSKNQIDDILDRVENFAGNKKYSSLNLTAIAWLKKEKPLNRKYEEEIDPSMIDFVQEVN